MVAERKRRGRQEMTWGKRTGKSDEAEESNT